MKEIKLTQDQVALVDDEDFEYLNDFPWCSYKRPRDKTYYATNSKLGKMHRVILNAKSGVIVDHIDGNGLNNQKSNLRFCTSAQNGMNRGVNKNNSHGFKGVSTNGRSGKNWKAEITKDRKRIYLGNFSTAEQAARAYDEAAKRMFGDFSYLNFPKAYK